MTSLFRLLERIQNSDATVLVLGENGTGKELVARAIHEQSPRCGQPLVSVNCGAIAESLIESVLFGHERGAFTGAAARSRGVFETAGGGTVFLDEVAELPPKAQVALLRVLETGKLTRVGSSAELQVDVRVVAATNRDLPALVKAGTFREDLYFRLAVFPVHLPPLRQRRDDIPLLVDHFIDRFRSVHRQAPADTSQGISERALAVMMAYDWPGNVRELQNVMERAVILESLLSFKRAGADGTLTYFAKRVAGWLREA